MSYFELYKFLIEKRINLINELSNSNEIKDRLQESIFNLFTIFGIKSSKLDGFRVQYGNFNEGYLEELKHLNTFLKKKIISGNDKSDLTLINPLTKEMIICSSKNKKKLTSNDLDISQIKDVFNKHFLDKGYKLIFCFVIRNRNQIKKIIRNSKKSSEYLVEVLKDSSTIIIDWNDLNIFYDSFYIKYKNKKSIKKLIINKKTMNLRFHQKLSIDRTIKLLLYNNKILWGHIPRSGKSYIMAGTIFRDSNNKDSCNYLIITSVPNETINQYFEIFDNYSDFEDINCVRLISKKKPKLSKKNILICSIQFLYNKKLKWLNRLNIDITICDESHYGLTAKLSSEQLKYHGSKKYIYMTATYSKPSKYFNINKECHVLWDFEDINLCKNIDNKDNYIKLIKKYNCKKIIDLYGIENIKKSYKKFPKLEIITINFEKDILNKLLNLDEHGFSFEALTLLKDNGKSNDFIEPDKLLKFCYYIFGRKGLIPTNCILNRIKHITTKNDSRFIYGQKPLVILCFLPCGGNSMSIDKVSKCFSKFLKDNLDYFEYDFDIVVINSKITNDPKKLINKKINKTKKKIILVLSGRQCSIGVTIPLCDIVMLFNNTQSLDMIQQMMFRSMSESYGKTCGFLVDLNVRRVSNLVVNYASKIYSSDSINEGILKIYESKLININSDLNNLIETKKNKTNKYLINLRNNIYRIWCENPYSNIIGILNELNYLDNDYPSNIQILINNLKLRCDNSKKINKENKIKDGIKIIKSKKDSEEYLEEEYLEEEYLEEVKKEVNFNNILKFLIPLVCLLSIEYKSYDFNEILNFINKNKKMNFILINHLNSCFNNNNIYTNIMNILDKTNLKDNDEIKRITKIIKELFNEKKYNRKELSKLFDRYLIPQEIEKKNNAEVSTPYKLRQEMLDKIPNEFWRNLNHKVFEPCCGKSGFLLDIIDRFMEGLKDIEPDESKRYKHIVEKCLYYADINPLNIYISELLLNPDKNLKLNNYEGNTLELDIKENFDLDGFDAVIGNPPYNNKGGIKKGGKNLYVKFTIFSINIVNKNGYLLFITPTGVLKTTVYSKKTNVLEKILSNTIITININECSKYFKKIGSTFTYFLIIKNNKKNRILNIKSKVNNNIYEYKNIEKYNLNFIPNILNNITISIINKLSLKNFNFKRIDKNIKIKNLEYDNFIYIKRLDHLNFKNPYMKPIIGSKDLKIKGPILVTEYNKNKLYILKSKIFAFINIITRYDAVIYHNFINLFGFIDKDINNIKELYKLYNFNKLEVDLIEKIIK